MGTCLWSIFVCLAIGIKYLTTLILIWVNINMYGLTFIKF